MAFRGVMSYVDGAAGAANIIKLIMVLMTQRELLRICLHEGE